MDENIRNEYLNITRKMLSLGIIKISDIYPKVRIANPEFYFIALTYSNKTSKQSFLEDLKLLCQDIQKCNELLTEYDLFEKQRKYIEHIIYEEENDCYNELVTNLLISNNLHLSDLSRTLRINNPNYYIYALKVCSTVNSMIENLTLLCEDIDSLESKSPEKDYLLKRLSLFINPVRYFGDDENMILFAKKANDKYLAQYENE